MDMFNHAAGHAGRGGMGLPRLFHPMFLDGRIATAIMAGLLIYFTIQWLFRSAGLYHLAKKRDISHAWFAWIPFLSNYILGELDNGKVIFGESLVTEDAEFYLPLVSLISFTISLFGMRSWLVQVLIVVMLVYKAGALWRLFKIYKPGSRVAYTICSFIFGSGFFIYAIRNEKPFDELSTGHLTVSNSNLAFEGTYEPVLNEENNSEPSKKHTDYDKNIFSTINNTEKEKNRNKYAGISDYQLSELDSNPLNADTNYSENNESIQDENKLANNNTVDDTNESNDELH